MESEFVFLAAGWNRLFPLCSLKPVAGLYITCICMIYGNFHFCLFILKDYSTENLAFKYQLLVACGHERGHWKDCSMLLCAGPGAHVVNLDSQQLHRFPMVTDSHGRKKCQNIHRNLINNSYSIIFHGLYMLVVIVNYKPFYLFEPINGEFKLTRFWCSIPLRIQIYIRIKVT